MFSLLPKRWRRGILAVACIGTSLLVGDTASAQGIGPHLGGGVLAGQAAGLDDGYVHFGGFVPLAQPTDSVLLFADGSLLLHNEGSDALGCNAGLGGRFLSPELNRIFGGYVYYDRRDLGAWEVDQVGFGLETLGQKWDARFNANLPTESGPGLSGVNATFAGSGIVLNGVEQNALRVVEAEVGAVVKQWENTQLKAFAGVYGLFDSSIDDVAGVRGRLAARVNDQLWVGGFLEHDDVFDTTGGFTLQWRFGNRGNNSGSNLLARLGDPVVRRRHVAIERIDHNDTPLTASGSTLSVTHVNDDGPTTTSLTTLAGDGSLENPFTTLDEASNSTSDVVFVHGGEYVNQSLVVSQAGQIVSGNGAGMTVSSDRGSFSLLGGTEAVVLRDSPGNAITIAADDVSVIGFQIVNPVASGISGNDGILGAQIINNTIEGAGNFGILFESAGGTVQGNVLTGNLMGIVVLGEFRGSILENQINNQLNSGIFIGSMLRGDLKDNQLHDNGRTTSDASIDLFDVIGNISGNTVTQTDNSAGDLGISLANLTGDLRDNTVTSHPRDGIIIGGTVLGNVVNNTANDNGGVGIRIGDNVSGDLANNTANDNGDAGIRIGEEYDLPIFTVAVNVEGSVYGNSANRNVGDGLSVSGQIGGDLRDNTANENSIGIVVGSNSSSIGAVFGSVLRNTANSNDEDGILLDVGLVGGELTGNTANENNLTGIDVRGQQQGVVSGNIANNNDIGFSFNRDLDQDFTGNTANGNTLDGVTIFSDVLGGVFDNTANNNGDDGIDVDGTINGTTSPNTTTGNGDQGFEN